MARSYLTTARCRRHAWLRLSAVMVVTGAVGCSGAAGDDDDSRESAPAVGGGYPGVYASGGAGANTYGGSGGSQYSPGVGTGGSGGSSIIVDGDGGMAGSTEPPPPPPPPEDEEEASFRAPVTTGEDIWAANPQSGYVARINARTLEVQVIRAGWAPTYLAAVPERSAAIVLNASSSDATLMPMREGTVHEADLETYPTHQGANAWALSRHGSWAIAWTNVADVYQPDSAEMFQQITVIDLVGQETTQLVVGRRPVSVSFNAEETRAFVVSQDGITAIDLGTLDTEAIDVTEDPLAMTLQPDVTITPDGSWALVRIPVSAEMPLEEAVAQGSALRFVDLTSDDEDTRITTETVPDGYYVTDLDLSEDGSTAVAAVYRPANPDTGSAADSWVVIVPIPDGIGDSEAITELQIPDQVFRQVALSHDGSTAVLFTRDVEGASDRITILDTDETDPTYRTVDVNAAVQTAFVAPNAEHAIVTQSAPSGSARAGAFSVVPLQDEIWPKLVGTDAAPQSVVFSPSGSHGLVTVRDVVRGVYGVHVVAMPSLRDDFIQLASEPLATGIVAEVEEGLDKGYVSQSHPEGRITIVNLPLSDPPARTITGFEINAD